MSTAITIQQKGVAQNITVDKLQVHKAGGTAYWVPEDTVELSALTATANGEYSAASAGKYGYGYASVSVPGSSVTGTGSDGNQHVITTDGSGAIVDTKVPSEIRIITPPDYVGPYGDGAYISFEGLTVEAFYADGTSAGVIDPQDLNFPVTVARYNPNDAPLQYLRIDDIDTDPIEQPIPVSDIISGKITWIKDGEEYVGKAKMKRDNPLIDHTIMAILKTPNSSWYSIIAVSEIYAEINITRQWAGKDEITTNYALLETTYAGRTFYYKVISSMFFGPRGTGYTEEEISIDNELINKGEAVPSGHELPAAYVMLFGSTVGTSGGMQIPVQYQRPGDGLILEDTFGIEVVPGPSGGDDT